MQDTIKRANDVNGNVASMNVDREPDHLHANFAEKLYNFSAI